MPLCYFFYYTQIVFPPVDIEGFSARYFTVGFFLSSCEYLSIYRGKRQAKAYLFRQFDYYLFFYVVNAFVFHFSSSFLDII
jgi:hypothetical protein